MHLCSKCYDCRLNHLRVMVHWIRLPRAKKETIEVSRYREIRVPEKIFLMGGIDAPYGQVFIFVVWCLWPKRYGNPAKCLNFQHWSNLARYNDMLPKLKIPPFTSFTRPFVWIWHVSQGERINGCNFRFTYYSLFEQKKPLGCFKLSVVQKWAKPDQITKVKVDALPCSLSYIIENRCVYRCSP